MSSPALSPMKRPWIVIACAAFIVTLAMGVRQSFGLFLPQMSVDIGISRSDFGLAMALQNLLFGLVQPFVGAIADKHGAGRVVLAGALLYALGLIGAAFATDAIGLHISFGIFIGMAQSATTFVVVLGAVGRVVSPEKRSGAFGIVTAGGSLGQFLVVPLTSGIVGRIFGIRYLSMLYGIVFLSHQLGSFFGAWMAGLIFDSTGSYNIAWGFSIALGLFAGLVHLPIADAPVKRLQSA